MLSPITLLRPLSMLRPLSRADNTLGGDGTALGQLLAGEDNRPTSLWTLVLPGSPLSAMWRDRRAGAGVVMLGLAAVCLICRWQERVTSRPVLEDREWLDAIPAFGAAMSTDDLTRQIHWLRKHNAAHPRAPPATGSGAGAAGGGDGAEAPGAGAGSGDDEGPPWLLRASRVVQASASPQPLYLTTPDGAALQPANAAAVKSMRTVVADAYSDEAHVVAARTAAARARMERKLHAQLAVMAKKIMVKLSEKADAHLTVGALHHLVQALGASEVARHPAHAHMTCTLCIITPCIEGCHTTCTGGALMPTAPARLPDRRGGRHAPCRRHRGIFVHSRWAPRVAKDGAARGGGRGAGGGGGVARAGRGVDDAGGQVCVCVCWMDG